MREEYLKNKGVRGEEKLNDGEIFSVQCVTLLYNYKKNTALLTTIK